MSDTSPLSPPANQVVEPKSNKLVIYIKRIPHGLHKAFSLAAWLMPFIMLVVGYSVFPSLRSPVTWPWRAPAEVWGPLFLIFFVLVIWILFEFYYAVHRNTSVRQLQADDGVSLAGAIILTFIAGALVNAGTMEWWFLLPLIGSVVDAFGSGFLAINNAAQKPFLSTKGGT